MHDPNDRRRATRAPQPAALYTPVGPTPPVLAPSDGLIEAVVAASAESWRNVEWYQAELFAYVDALRTAGYDVVRTVLAVKRVAERVPPKLLEQSVRRCTERYYMPR